MTREESLTYLEEYGRVPIAFEVRSLLDVRARGVGLDGFDLSERPVARPYVKDYDAIPGNRPTEWARQFDLSHWGVLSARLDGLAVGGAVLAFQTPGLDMLESRADLAVVWDLRVAPAARRRGVGTALLEASVRWAVSRGCRELKVETQHINVPACRLYASQGFAVGASNPSAYPDFPEEIQLLWYRRLVAHA